MYIDAKIYSAWSVEAMQLYLNMLCGLKNRDFYIMINGIMCNDKMSIGSLRPQVIRAVPNQFNIVYNIISVVNLEVRNIHAVNLKHNGCYINLTAPRNIMLGQAFAMWRLLGINIPPFEYLQVDNRRVSKYEYNVEQLNHWPWSKMLTLMSELKGGAKDDVQKISGILKRIVITSGLGFWENKEEGKITLTKITKERLMNLCESCVIMMDKLGPSFTICDQNVFYCEVEFFECIDIIDEVGDKLEDGYELTPEDILFSMWKDLMFVVDILRLNLLNEEDRKILVVTDFRKSYLMFGGRFSAGISALELAIFEENTEKQNLNPTLKKALVYRLLITGDYDNDDGMIEFAEIIAEHQALCIIMIEKFKEDEEIEAEKRSW
jgi:hypothetical protein